MMRFRGRYPFDVVTDWPVTRVKCREVNAALGLAAISRPIMKHWNAIIFLISIGGDLPQ